MTLAFNTIGWQSQNFLFNTIDALLGTSIGTAQPDEVVAYIKNSNVTAGQVSVTTASLATIDAEITSASTAFKINGQGSPSVSVGAVIAMNKIATQVQSYIDGATTVTAGNGDISIGARNAAAIDSVVSASSLSFTGTVTASTSVSVGLSVARNEIDNEMSAYMNNVGQATATNGSVKLSAAEAASIDTSRSRLRLRLRSE